MRQGCMSGTSRYICPTVHACVGQSQVDLLLEGTWITPRLDCDIHVDRLLDD